MERPEIYTDNYNSLEEWIELRKRNEEFVYPQFFVPFREWMKDIEQKSDMEIKELLRILLQPYTLGVDTVDTYEFYKEYVQDQVNKEKNLQTYELCMNQLKYNERIYRIKNKQEAWEGLTWVLPLLNINPMKALKALGMYFDAECIYMPDDRIYGISDAMDIIEEKYIKSASDKNAYIFSLTSREFEILIAILYEALGYEDRFVTRENLIALSKHPRKVNSSDADHFFKRTESDKENKILLFVRKNKDDKEAKEFYFLGEVFAQGEPIPIKMEKTGDDAFEINYKLDVPVREDIYEYIVSEA